jgi:hypothetical protein
MKSDCNGLVEQSEMNQSVDENFNTQAIWPTVVAYELWPFRQFFTAWCERVPW